MLLLRIHTLAGGGGGAAGAVAAVSQEGLELGEIKQGLELGKKLALANYFTAADGTTNNKPKNENL